VRVRAGHILSQRRAGVINLAEANSVCAKERHIINTLFFLSTVELREHEDMKKRGKNNVSCETICMHRGILI
jgi:hypothetical protein